MSIVKYALNEHAHSRVNFTVVVFCLYPPPYSFNQSYGQRVLISEAN